MNPENTYGLAALIAQSDWVGRSALALLAAMSLASWYCIVQRLVEHGLATRSRRRFLVRLRAAADAETFASVVAQPGGDDTFAPVAARALGALAHCREHGAQCLDPSATAQEFVAHAVRAVIAEQRLAAERGLTLLASVGATAPFVGLFGTVWGVYHALVGIGLSGQGTLDKVAGPVGEALIMTALGLVVAVPAVLAYNAFTRGNRVLATELEAFGHELLARLASGAPLVRPEHGR